MGGYWMPLAPRAEGLQARGEKLARADTRCTQVSLGLSLDRASQYPEAGECPGSEGTGMNRGQGEPWAVVGPTFVVGLR